MLLWSGSSSIPLALMSEEEGMLTHPPASPSVRRLTVGPRRSAQHLSTSGTLASGTLPTRWTEPSFVGITPLPSSSIQSMQAISWWRSRFQRAVCWSKLNARSAVANTAIHGDRLASHETRTGARQIGNRLGNVGSHTGALDVLHRQNPGEEFFGLGHRFGAFRCHDTGRDGIDGNAIGTGFRRHHARQAD